MTRIIKNLLYDALLSSWCSCYDDRAYLGCYLSLPNSVEFEMGRGRPCKCPGVLPVIVGAIQTYHVYYFELGQD